MLRRITASQSNSLVETIDGSVDFVGDSQRDYTPAEGARALADRTMHPDIQPDNDLADDTRLWAALQRVGGGAWGGCVYDVERIIDTLDAGERALQE